VAHVVAASAHMKEASTQAGLVSTLPATTQSRVLDAQLSAATLHACAAALQRSGVAGGAACGPEEG
jgi:hypothetical protein